ncbi:ribosomal RNA small subunit methyltransferase A [Patescibacteria group bacterium]|nr:ribosomal RNA small subunit methyltransferase A [Patescibacteria group bacterium]
MNKSELHYLLKKYDIQPKRDFGQNFLIDQNIINKIIKTADLQKNDVVLEIGAGFGNLTQALSENCEKVIAVEPDNEIFPVLENLSKANPNIIPIKKGIFDVDFSAIPEIKAGKYKIVANLPYQITSHVFRTFLEHGPQPKAITVMIQKEVAERIMAKVGQKNLLALSIEFYSDPEIAFKVSRSCFYPQPKVDSAVVHLPKIGKKHDIDEKRFFQVLKIGFSSKRKTLVNNLRNGLKLDKNELIIIFNKQALKENIRPQELDLEQWVKLIDAVSHK